MRHRITHRALASLFFFGGAWACVVSLYLLQLGSLGIFRGLGPVAGVIALTMCAAGVIWFFRPVIGMTLAIAALIPQAFSFAVGNVVYAVHFWPNCGIEFLVPGPGSRVFDASINSCKLSPTWRLSTDASYVGTGFGVEIVSLTIIVALIAALMATRRTGNAPNQSFKPTPSARLN